MTVLRTIKPQHVIYEHVELNILVAISVDLTDLIKKYWKENKGKSVLNSDKISGFRMIHDENQDSLNIAFDNQEQFEIKQLKKYT